MTHIRFGTDGWRAQMGREFSFKNVRIFAGGYAQYLKKKKKKDNLKIIVNYDTRFLSKKFAQETARILSLEHIETFVPERDVPLAPISLAIIQNKYDGGVTFTASFSKPVYNGIKVFDERGVTALPGETQLIEDEIEKIAGNYVFQPRYPNNSLINQIDVQEPYIDYIESLIDFELIKDSGAKIIVDNLYGTSREYLDYVLSKNHIDIETIHGFINSPFEGIISSCSKSSLADLSKLVVEQAAHIGLATDIDGDRFGIVDSRGKYMSSNLIMPPLIDYLIRVRKMEGGIVKSLSATNNIRKVAEYYGRQVYSTPVGFKYLADVMCSKDAFIAVESSNGASLKSIINIKDGILFNLLVTEMLAYYKMDWNKILTDFYSRFPHLYNFEIAMARNEARMERFRALVERNQFSFDSYKLKEVKRIDGIKFLFEDSWLLLRESGTNNVIRLYAESDSVIKARKLIKIGRGFIE